MPGIPQKILHIDLLDCNGVYVYVFAAARYKYKPFTKQKDREYDDAKVQ